MKAEELIQQYVTAHADNRWMDASELEALLTEFAEKLIALQPKSREERFREYLQSSSAERRKFDLSFLDETRKEALAVLTDLGYECKLQQEPASEDLEQASIEHAHKVHNDTAPGERIAACRYDFKAGAQWQKEQMIKDAIEGYVARDKNMGLFLYKEEPVLNKRFGGFWQGERSLCIPRRLFIEQKWNDKPLNVKVIIIPSDNK